MRLYYRARDNKFRYLHSAFEVKRIKLNFFLQSSIVDSKLKVRIKYIHNKKLGKIAPNFFRYRNTCLFTNKGNSVFRYFKLSRMPIKILASTGYLAGVGKSSW